MQVCKSKAQTSFLSFSLVLRCTNVHNEGAAFYLEDTKRGNIVTQTERRLAVGPETYSGIVGDRARWISIFHLFSTFITAAVFKTLKGKYTQTLAHTHKYYAHTGTYIQKTWIKIFLFFLENVLKIILKISKKNFTVQLYITNSFKHFP